MSRGRRVEKTYIGFNGAATDRMQELLKLAKTPAGQFGRVAAHSRKAVRLFIEAQLCPWCEEGPYKILASHTHRAHGISADELRELAGVTKTTSICDPDHSENCRERQRGKALPATSKPRKRNTYNSAGLAVQRAKLAAARSPEQQRAAAAASAARTLAANQERHAEIARLFEGGLPLTTIAETVGCCGATVRRTLARLGLWEGDGRSIRWQRAPEEALTAVKERLSANKAARVQALAEDTRSLVGEFEAVGADYAAVRRLARKCGISTKSMAERLRGAGVSVPDGRAEAESRFGLDARAAMVAMYAQGKSQSEIARHFGTGQAHVSTILRSEGIQPRPFRRMSRA